MNTKQKVSYKGSMVDKDNFRVFVYGQNDKKKLVENWDQFQIAIQSGDWFESTVIEDKEQKVKKSKKSDDSVA